MSRTGRTRARMAGPGSKSRQYATAVAASRYAAPMLPPATLPLLAFAAAGVLGLVALTAAVTARRRWREGRFIGGLWRVVLAAGALGLAMTAGLAGLSLKGWQRLSAEAPVALLETRALGGRAWQVVVELPDGSRQQAVLQGDDWQLDAQVIKWSPRAVALGAPPLYRLDRIAGRWRDAGREGSIQKAVASLANPQPLDLWSLKHRYPRWLPLVDVEFGSSAYLPFVDGGRFQVTLAASGGLVARPADARTAGALGRRAD